ncbi:uncharacterized protein [Magallana gigas]|uniref:uncharacterized protein isoform X2 n=1 Tax=Magallana gigas TaxID=29159 RepID=UPI0033416529
MVDFIKVLLLFLVGLGAVKCTSVSIDVYGRVVAHTMNGPGTVCGYMWDDVDADVVCRQMGFATGTATLLPQDPVFTRMFYDVSCKGNETEIQSCHSYDYDFSLVCSMFEDAGVSCSGMPSGGHSDVTIGSGGRVLAHDVNGTGTVCGDQWDDIDADVLCRQMGFPSGTATVLPRDYMFNRHIYNVRCLGNETQVQECPVDKTDMFGSCSSVGDAGVSCAQNGTAGTVVGFATDGRVLAHTSNVTGTVCGYMWDDVDADVLCRQMGFPSGTATLLPRDPVFNRVFFEVNCIGNETDIQSCHAFDHDVSAMCSMYEDAGVSCSGMTSGSSPSIAHDGRVLANNMNGTGTVCGYMWDDTDADVLCRQMGFPSGIAILMPRDPVFNRFVFNVNCLGNETDIQSCPAFDYDVSGMCSMYEDAGVICSGMTSGGHSNVTIGPGGRVLAQDVNGTGTVCGDQWDDIDANVLCRQMGFASGTATILPRDYMFNRHIFNVRCLGNETHVQECPVDKTGSCSSIGDAGVSCVQNGTAGTVVGFATDGRVLAHTSNVTGTVCGYMWDDVDAEVLCRQMGFPSGTATLLPRDPVFNRVFFEVNCIGNETDIQSCHAFDHDVSAMCSMYEDAGVSCSGMTSGGSPSIAHDGRVLANNMNGTGTVCGYMWDDTDADVLCRQMGFPSGIAILMPRDPVFNRFVFNVNCLGNETDIQSCPAFDYDVSGMCSMYEDAGVICSGMTSGGHSNVTIGPGGRVLAQDVNGTGTVCGDQWDDIDANVLCRQMGFASGTATYLPRDYMFNRHIYNVRCLGNETHVQECPVDKTGSCSSIGDAGVSCVQNGTAGTTVSIDVYGRVVAHTMNGPGTVCGYMWDDVDADVVCRQMGFTTGTATLLPQDPVFNRVFYDVSCMGTETEIQACHAYDYDVSLVCSMFEDAGVSCSGMPSGGHSDVSIGSGGRVLAHDVNGTGTVCGDQWDDIDADVLCRQMGFPSGTATILPRDYMFNRHIFNVRCLGNETQVQQCPVDKTDMFGSCSSVGDAGVICAQNGTAGTVVGFATDGRVLAHTSNVTGTVCGYMWDDVDAEVLCRQMGFPSGTATLLPRDPVFNRVFFEVNCIGNETDIQSCHAFDHDVSAMCSMYEDAGVSCSGMTSGGSPSIAHDGRVLANNMNGTGTVCGYMWDDTDADVLCRQMGFPSGIAILMPRDPVFNRFVFNVNCLGNETDIQSCPAFDYDVSGMCSMYEDAGVICSGMTSGGHSNVTIGPGGRVLAQDVNGTGTVCGDQWDDIDANVLCRQMGFASGTATYLPRDYMFNRHIYNVRCLGNETHVQECPVDKTGSCSSIGDAGVSCVQNGTAGTTVSIDVYGRVVAHTMNGPGTVCGYMWDDVDADVVCRQMGFTTGTATLLPQDPVFNRVFYDVSCMGTETEIQACHAYDYDVSLVCSMFEDAGVSCSGMPSGGHSDVSIGSGGRVLAHDVNGTGTVCGDQWDDIDADVLCRQMGFPSGTATILPRDYMFNRHIFNVRCLGNETQVQQCPVDKTDMFGSCSSVGDAGVICAQNGTAGTVVGFATDGRVLAHTSNVTGTVCGYMWDDVDAEVLCRQMGFPSGTATLLPRDPVFNRVFFEVNCIGNETDIQSCHAFDHDVSAMCSMYEDAGVSCSGMTSGGSPSIAHDGRVLANNMNGTGTVCGYMWDDTDADVLCRQMGFPSGIAILMPRDPVFNRFVFNVNCLGNETDIQSCPAFDYDVSGMCSMYEDAGVICSGMTSGGHSNVTIGPGGRVLAQDVNGTGTVCGDQWDDIDANVLCRQMGFASGTATYLPRDYMFNRHIYNVRCLGNETHVQECPVDKTGSCSSIGDAGVSCVQNGTAGTTVSIDVYGRVVAHTMNGPGTVCGYMWDDVDADVVCRQMGFTTGTATLLPQDPVFNRVFYDVSCMGTETEIQACHAYDYDVSLVCSMFEDAGVSCSGMPSGGHSDVSIGSGGRVLAHDVNGTGTVCGDQWDDIDADVLCRQMGFPSGTATILPRDYMFNRHIFNVRCLGNETQVQQCPVDKTDMFGSCSSVGDAGVICAQNGTAGTVVGFATDGRVLAHTSNVTGTVCGYMWDDVDAEVLCRQMGFPSGTATLLPRDPVLNRVFFEVNCIGNETDIQSCHAFDHDVSAMCSMYEDAGVSCSGMTSGGSPSIAHDGRVLANNMNGTGTVCGYMWDDTDADVLCRQMGFPSGIAILMPRDPVFNRFVFNVNCLGNETDIQSCPAFDYDVSGMCSMYEDAGVICSGMTSGGHSNVTIGPGGRVLAQDVNGTGTVCGDQWDDIDANVLCRQMGFASGTATYLPRDYMFNRHIYNVRCLGNETHVQECPVDKTGSCSSIGDAGVSCVQNGTAGTTVSIDVYGRVVAHTMNGPGTVCGYMWDDVDADVVCRQMGFTTGTATLLPQDPVFNRVFYDVSCMGTETEIQACHAYDYDVSLVCSMFEDAGVSCSGMPSGGHSDVSIGSGGRVLAHDVNGTGTVCGDQWDDIDADVLCRQMGFPSGTATILPRDYMFNRHIFNVRCLGNETQVQQCPVDKTDMFGSCSSVGDAGVICAQNGTAGTVVGFATDGRVLAHTSNVTGTVCGYMWDDVDAEVLCRQMGFPSGTATLLPRDPVFNRVFFEVNCIGNETDIQSCHAFDHDVSAMCSMYEDAGVSCSGMTSGGSPSIAHDGRVLANNMNGTGTVCGYMWDDTDADVLCRQMGFPSGIAILMPRDPVFNRFVFNVNCLGNETDIQSCPAFDYDVSGLCSMYEDAGVICSGMTSGGHSNVTIGPGGRVLAQDVNGTGTVCGDQWDDIDANVLCRQMGFASGTATYLPRDYMFNRHIYNVRCLGNETHVQECPVDKTGSCSSIGDAGVSCMQNGTAGVVNTVYIGQDGRVMASHNVTGYTGTVCGYMWDDLDAMVLCQQFGYPSGIAKQIPTDHNYNRVIFNVQCMGMEPDVYACPVEHSDTTGNCPMANDAGVECENMTSQYPSTQTTITQTFAGQTSTQQASTQFPYTQTNTQQPTTNFSQTTGQVFPGHSTTEQHTTQFPSTSQTSHQQTTPFSYTTSQASAGQTSTQGITTQVPQTSSHISTGQNTTNQVTTHVPMSTSQVSAGHTTQQATTHVPMSTSQVSAGHTTQQATTHVPMSTSLVSAGHTTQQATTHVPMSTSQVTAGHTTQQATTHVPMSTSQASAGQTSTQGITTQVPQTSSHISTGQNTTNQVTTHVPMSTSQVSAGHTTQQATTHVPMSTSQASAGHTTQQATTHVPMSTSQVTAGHTTQQATTHVPMSTSQASAGHTTQQATTHVPITSSQASAGQTTTQQATTHVPITSSQASAGQTTTQQATTHVPITSSQASAGQTTTQQATTHVPITSSQASAGQTTTQQATTHVPITSSQASAGQTTTQQATTHVPITSSQASAGQTTTQATTQATQTTSQASAGQTTTPSAGQTTQSQTTSINCQPGSGSCILQMDSLGAGAETRMASSVFIVISSVVSVLCLVFMY